MTSGGRPVLVRGTVMMRLAHVAEPRRPFAGRYLGGNGRAAGQVQERRGATARVTLARGTTLAKAPGPCHRAWIDFALTWVEPEGRGNLRGLAPTKREWSPRYEEGVYNRSGGEDMQGRAPDREQVVRLGPLPWISYPRLAGPPYSPRASAPVPQRARHALGRPASRGLSYDLGRRR